MNIHILSFIFGSLLKIYDDIIDNPLYHVYFNKTAIEIIKVLTIACITAISIANANFPFILFLVMVLHTIFTHKENIDDPFYYAGMLLLFILICVTYSELILQPIIFITIILVCSGVYVDHKLVPEEHSTKKIICRVFYLIMATIFYNSIPIEYDILVFACGYLSTSVINMILSEVNVPKIISSTT